MMLVVDFLWRLPAGYADQSEYEWVREILTSEDMDNEMKIDSLHNAFAMVKALEEDEADDSEEKRNNAMADNRSCKATLYLESPGFLIPSRLKDAVMKREADVGAVTGHAFIGLTDQNGKETVYGFHAATALPENENLSFKEKLPLLVSGKYQGFVADDSKEPYDDKMVYHITPKQYDKIKSYVEKEKPTRRNTVFFPGTALSLLTKLCIKPI